MRQIWKFTIDPRNMVHEIPKGGIVRHVDEQRGEICIWVEVDPSQPKEKRYFEAYGTAHFFHEDMGVSREYLGSAKLNGGNLVFHVYENTGA